jgi:hypothetical protein
MTSWPLVLGQEGGRIEAAGVDLHTRIALQLAPRHGGQAARRKGQPGRAGSIPAGRAEQGQPWVGLAAIDQRQPRAALGRAVGIDKVGGSRAGPLRAWCRLWSSGRRGLLG